MLTYNLHIKHHTHNM